MTLAPFSFLAVKENMTVADWLPISTCFCFCVDRTGSAGSRDRRRTPVPDLPRKVYWISTAHVEVRQTHFFFLWFWDKNMMQSIVEARRMYKLLNSDFRTGNLHENVNMTAGLNEGKKKRVVMRCGELECSRWQNAHKGKPKSQFLARNCALRKTTNAVHSLLNVDRSSAECRVHFWKADKNLVATCSDSSKGELNVNPSSCCLINRNLSSLSFFSPSFGRDSPVLLNEKKKKNICVNQSIASRLRGGQSELLLLPRTRTPFCTSTRTYRVAGTGWNNVHFSYCVCLVSPFDDVNGPTSCRSSVDFFSYFGTLSSRLDSDWHWIIIECDLGDVFASIPKRDRWLCDVHSPYSRLED